jgi:hypothetical protein
MTSAEDKPELALATPEFPELGMEAFWWRQWRSSGDILGPLRFQTALFFREFLGPSTTHFAADYFYDLVRSNCYTPLPQYYGTAATG